MLRAEEEGLHERVGELVSALKSEQIYPEQLRELAGSQHASTSDKLLDIADVFEHMLALSGGSMLDGRDQEKLAQSKFAGSSYIKNRILLYLDLIFCLRLECRAWCNWRGRRSLFGCSSRRGTMLCCKSSGSV